MTADANMDIRVLMLKNGIKQAKLGELLGITQPEVSVMLKHELSREQKKRIRDAIAGAEREG